MGRQTIARVFFPQIRIANKSPDHFFSSLNAISMSHSSKRHGIGQWRRIYQSLWIIIQMLSPRIYPRSYHFCLASAEQKEWKFDLIRKVDIVVVLKFHCGGPWRRKKRCLERVDARHSAVSRVSFRIVLLVDQRRWDRRRGDGRQGNVINFKRDFYCGRGGRGKGAGVRLNVWRFIGSLKSFTATGKFYMVVQ